MLSAGSFVQNSGNNLPEIAFDSHKKFVKLYYSAYADPNPSNS